MDPIEALKIEIDRGAWQMILRDGHAMSPSMWDAVVTAFCCIEMCAGRPWWRACFVGTR